MDVYVIARVQSFVFILDFQDNCNALVILKIWGEVYGNVDDSYIQTHWYVTDSLVCHRHVWNAMRQSTTFYFIIHILHHTSVAM